MGDKKVGGFIFRTYKNDHRPYHVHIIQGNKELGRFDIENQRSMDERLEMTGQLRKALRQGGYLK